MLLKELQADRKIALMEKNKIHNEVITAILARAKSIAIEKGLDREKLSDELIIEAVLKEKKMCQEGLDACPANRTDLIETHKMTLEYINKYAPQMMTEEEVRKKVFHIIATTDIQQTGKGAIMKAVMPRLKGKADGKIINKIVDEIVAKTGE